jgi:UMF1 family MFS transporter
VRVAFLMTAAWWAVFTIPILRDVRQKYSVPREPQPILNSLRRLAKTIRNIASYRAIFIFLLAYFFYIDGVNTIIHMATVYGVSVGISDNMLLAALLFIQIVAFPFAILYGKLAGRVGAYTMILVGIGVYVLVCILGYRMQTALDFWILGFLVATSQGGIQALSRSYFGKMVPKENSNEFFGFYDIFGKFAAILGPLLFGVASQMTGESRFGVLAVIILFIIGGLIFIFGVGPTRSAARPVADKALP